MPRAPRSRHGSAPRSPALHQLISGEGSRLVADATERLLAEAIERHRAEVAAGRPSSGVTAGEGLSRRARRLVAALVQLAVGAGKVML